MDTSPTKPGPDAGRAFRLGMVASAVAALGGIALLYRYGLITSTALAIAVVVLFPVYLLVVASVLSVWLDFDKDASDLRPVYRERRDRS